MFISYVPLVFCGAIAKYNKYDQQSDRMVVPIFRDPGVPIGLENLGFSCLFVKSADHVKSYRCFRVDIVSSAIPNRAGGGGDHQQTDEASQYVEARKASDGERGTSLTYQSNGHSGSSPTL